MRTYHVGGSGGCEEELRQVNSELLVFFRGYAEAQGYVQHPIPPVGMGVIMPL
jgi:hypothetical protein